VRCTGVLQRPPKIKPACPVTGGAEKRPAQAGRLRSAGFFNVVNRAENRAQTKKEKKKIHSDTLVNACCDSFHYVPAYPYRKADGFSSLERPLPAVSPLHICLNAAAA